MKAFISLVLYSKFNTKPICLRFGVRHVDDGQGKSHVLTFRNLTVTVLRIIDILWLTADLGEINHPSYFLDLASNICQTLAVLVKVENMKIGPRCWGDRPFRDSLSRVIKSRGALRA